ncbi:uncharacterized protein LOC122513138 [Leptopilina heterotoma]|uniref:uncharacterized protein LOC122513138 n=1 Tax=Leptopilina heterotoma TaxID=63436 RepID=UPI001CA80ADE|nr:uncharacterized protein LOC122513138 [Leptopilina heterotoma]
MYSCYFSPNDALTDFEADIRQLESSLRGSRLDVLVTGDFNAKSPEWGESRLDKRGRVIGEMVSRSNLTIVNRGRTWTFRRGAIGSIIDLTIASSPLFRRINEWRVSEEYTASDHQYIEFSVSVGDTGNGGRQEAPCRKRLSWNVKKIDKEKFVRSLEESRLIEELGWVQRPNTMDAEVRAVRKTITAACDESMPRRRCTA